MPASVKSRSAQRALEMIGDMLRRMMEQRAFGSITLTIQRGRPHRVEEKRIHPVEAT